MKKIVRSPYVETLLSTAPKPTPPDLKDMAVAVNEVAKTARILITTMLGIALSLVATMISSTDEAIFLNSAKIFPWIGTEIRLSTAFIFIPPLFVFLHINALLQLHLLAKRIGTFRDTIAMRHISEEERRSWLDQIHGLGFAQWLIGDASGLERWLIAAVTVISLTIVPTLLLLTAQMCFVRYQNTLITIGDHALCLLLDFLILSWFYVKIFWRKKAYNSYVVQYFLYAIICEVISLLQVVPPLSIFDILSFGTTQPPEINEMVYDYYPDRIHNAWGLPINGYDVIVHYFGIYWGRRWIDLSNSVFSNGDYVKHIDVSNRSFVSANLNGIKIIGANFSRAKLMYADLSSSSLNKSLFYEANIDSANIMNAKIEVSDFTKANLTLAEMSGVKIKNSVFDDAQLFNVDFSEARLEGVRFKNAQLDRSIFYDAQLNGAIMAGAKMRFADFSGAQLRGADISHSELEGADFSNAQLQGVNLSGSNISLSVGNIKSCDLIITHPPAIYVEYTSEYALNKILIDAKEDGISYGMIKNKSSLSCNGKSIANIDVIPDDKKYSQLIVSIACGSGPVAIGIYEQYHGESRSVDRDDSIMRRNSAVLKEIDKGIHGNCAGLKELKRYISGDNNN